MEIEKIVSAHEVMELAFGGASTPHNYSITDTEIISAQKKFIKPVLGPMYAALSRSQYADFVNCYIKLPLALYVKSQVMRNAAVQIGSMGAVRYSGEHFVPASDVALATAIKCVRSDARTLLKEAVDYIEAHNELFPEYDPKQNIWSKMTMLGDVVI